MAGIPAWSGYVDEFLQQHDLTIRKTILPAP
jgi:hypothetical protein